MHRRELHPTSRPRLAGDVVKSLLRGVSVVDPSLERVFLFQARKHWPELGDDDCRVTSFHQGRMHVLVDTHARLAEARGFAAEEIRKGINATLASEMRYTKAMYVTRIDFHLRGTHY